ncbi:MAG: ROK family protein [Bacteroidales bacterium]|nr:MAG: ROK family protein [Bacteroidales bacterium]
MTLDAGGTNFVFSAIQSNNEIISPIILPSHADNLETCLSTIVKGFSEVKKKLSSNPIAISFAFPGPADYPAGIIGDLPNLPAFRGGVALGPMLEKHFDIPVYINNDGDLFVYGEAIAGLLPYVNELLSERGSSKKYRNLFGVTLGTGFGAGIVRNNELFTGDNAVAAEIWLMRNKKYPQAYAEEGASIRAVQKSYMKEAGIKSGYPPSPKEIFEIASGNEEGNSKAAQSAFIELGEIVGDALANAITLIDGLIVIGGGLAGAHSVFLPKIIDEMNGKIMSYEGKKINRLVFDVFNLEDNRQMELFLRGEEREILIPGSNETVIYDPLKRIGIGISKLGTSKATAIGAYAFALNSIDNIN